MNCKPILRNGKYVCARCGWGEQHNITEPFVRDCGIRKRAKVKRMPPNKHTEWSCGVTTVPERTMNLLPRTIASLVAAGFPVPHLFIDGEVMTAGYGEQVTARQPKLHIAGNWVLAIWELYLRNPKADRYAVFQDDLVAVRNLRQYLERCAYPEKGYWNLFTMPVNHKLAKGRKGWFESNQLGKGAVGLVFSNEAVRTLLTQGHLAERAQNLKRGWHLIDGGIIETFKIAGWKEWVHNPSLVQHTGRDKSTQGSKHPLAPAFPGEGFDAMDLLPKPPPPPTPPPPPRELGDMVEAALTSIGITSERVEKWLGRPCGCKERKEKLNRLSRWAKRIVLGQTDKAEEYLDEMLTE